MSNWTVNDVRAYAMRRLRDESHARERMLNENNHVVGAVVAARPERNPSRYLDEIDPAKVVCKAVHHGEPMPKQRPRFSPKGHAYTPQSTKEHQRSIASLITEQCANRELKADCLYGLRAVFYVQTFQRKDVDNLLKTLLDALNHVAFKDDSQIKELMGWSVIDFQNPRTEFVLYEIGIEDREQGYCVQCQKPFRRYASWKSRLFCSRECNALHSRKSVSLECECCHRVFVRPLSQKDAKFCSAHCRAKASQRTFNCHQCGKTCRRAQSNAKPLQSKFFCSRECYSIFLNGNSIHLTKEQLSARSKKTWITRKLQTTPTPESDGITAKSSHEANKVSS